MRARRTAVLSVAIALAMPTALTTVAVPALAADESISTRIDDGDAVLAAITVSQLRFADAGSSSGVTARHVVLSRDDDFADTLAGTPLTGQGPLLYTATAALTAATGDEIDRVLGPGGRVYVLGGTAAVSESVVTTLRDRGYDVRRLRGADRIATSVAIATEVRNLYGGREVLMARARGIEGSPGSGWADSVAGGARAADQRIPVLLTDTAGLDSRVAAWLASDGTVNTHLLGGTAALSQAVADAVPGAKRHRGADRTGTAAAIATGLWGAKDTGPRSFTIIDAAQDRGWAFGLAAAGLAADRDAPVLTTIGVVTPATRRMVATCGTAEVDLTIVGDGTLVSGAVREYLDDLDGEGCGPDRTLTRRASLRRFADCPDLIDWYRTNALERVTEYGLGGWYGGFFGGPEPMPVEEGAPTAAPQGEADASSDDGSAGAGRDVSGTNVQEVGVDEPDMMKTDGDVLAVVAQDGSVDLLDMTGATPRVASNLPAANPYGQTELLLIDDVLTTLTTTYSYAYFAEADVAFAPGLPQPVTTTVTRWNVGDPDNPAELSSFEVDGSYRSARMIDGVARIVIESGPHGLEFTYPQDDTEQERERALAHNKQVVRESTLANWLPSWGDAGSRGEGPLVVDCADVHEPPAWSGFDAITVITLDTRTDAEPGEAATVVAQGQNVYASTDRLLVTTGRWGEAFEGENLDSVATTELHAFDITNPADISYVGSGRVDGYVINQFALSEFGGDIRVAATKQPPWRDDTQQTSSFVSVLQEREGSLVEVGRVGGLGLGERIQSVRFYGDLGVVVTFRQIDPLYLLDMSESTAPRVTGELKDTGFSQYLHLVGDDLLMGVGVDADEEGAVTGAMIALYDISDRSAPTRVARLNVPDAWSPVGSDHRSFLFWPGTDDAFVPMSRWTGETQEEFAQVMRVDEPNRTMTRRGSLTQQGQDGVIDWEAQIRRSFIIDGSVYTVSWAGLARHDLSTLATTSFTAFPDRSEGRDEPKPVDSGGGTTEPSDPGTVTTLPSA